MFDGIAVLAGYPYVVRQAAVGSFVAGWDRRVRRHRSWRAGTPLAEMSRYSPNQHTHSHKSMS